MCTLLMNLSCSSACLTSLTACLDKISLDLKACLDKISLVWATFCKTKPNRTHIKKSINLHIQPIKKANTTDSSDL